MTQDEFMYYTNPLVAQVLETLVAKNEEYSRGDKLSNFKKVAAFRNKTPEETLWGMSIKHTTAIDDFIQDLDRGVVQPESRWNEKIVDSIAYLLLLNGLVQERLQKEKK